MAALPPRSERRRPRRGSLERPVNGRMYRGTWLLVAVPLLVAAFTVARPAPLPPPTLPPVFDRQAAVGLAADLARSHPDRSPGSAGARGAVQWLRRQLQPYGFRLREDRFRATIPGEGAVPLVNAIAVLPGRSTRAVIVMAHRDNTGAGPGANDNASGTAALVELARSYASTTPAAGRPGISTNTIVFLSSDGGAFGAIGAARFAARSSYGTRALAVLNLDALAGPGEPRVELAGDRPRSPAAALVRTAAMRLLETTGSELGRPSALAQLVDLGFPLSLYEQAPFVARGIPAVTLTTAGSRPPASFGDTPDRLDARRLGELGGTAAALLGSLDQGLGVPQVSSSYVYLGARFVRGWAIELVLIAAVLPFVVTAVDLFAYCRRRHIRLAPALRAFRSRLGVWLWAALVFAALALLGAWGTGEPRPPSPESESATSWPTLAFVVLAGLSFAGWLLARERLLPRRPVSGEEQLAGYTAAFLTLGVVALLIIATNPFALVFLLPSLHAWLWLAQTRDGRRAARAALLVGGFAGPALLLGSVAVRLGLGLDAPWYLAELVALGYVDPVAAVIVCGWLAAAGQVAALTAGRYAPYPARAERPPRGPLRELVRRVLLLFVRRREGLPRRRALPG